MPDLIPIVPAPIVAASQPYPPSSGWTVDTLREFLSRLLGELDLRYDARITEADKRYEQRYTAQEGAVQAALAAQEKAVNAALLAADRAVAKAESASERRFEGVNEFRAQLADQAATLMPRTESETRFTSLGEKQSEQALFARDQADRLRAEINAFRDEQARSLAVTRDEFSKAIVGLRDEFSKAITSILTSQSSSAGKSTGYSQSWTVAVAILGALLGIAGLVLAVFR